VKLKRVVYNKNKINHILIVDVGVVQLFENARAIGESEFNVLERKFI
jgi:hypothetical protein